MNSILIGLLLLIGPRVAHVALSINITIMIDRSIHASRLYSSGRNMKQGIIVFDWLPNSHFLVNKGPDYSGNTCIVFCCTFLKKEVLRLIKVELGPISIFSHITHLTYIILYYSIAVKSLVGLGTRDCGTLHEAPNEVDVPFPPAPSGLLHPRIQVLEVNGARSDGYYGFATDIDM
ncbi:MAG: hypothetical protein HPY71_05850 [Firmicutes bacterium]|nr:hypothetical protein [Bacillota bacterium]